MSERGFYGRDRSSFLSGKAETSGRILMAGLSRGKWNVFIYEDEELGNNSEKGNPGKEVQVGKLGCGVTPKGNCGRGAGNPGTEVGKGSLGKEVQVGKLGPEACCWVNRAVTERLVVSETEQAPVPLQAPPQPLNCHLVVGVGVRLTVLPLVYDFVQFVGQAIPAGALVTVPVPVIETESEKVVGLGVELDALVNCALTVRFVIRATEQVPVPLHAPPQLVNCHPVTGAGVSLTVLPLVYDLVQSAGQAMPEGLLVTVPLPLIETERVKVVCPVGCPGEVD